MYIDVKMIRNKTYHDFVSTCLKESRYIIITMLNESAPTVLSDVISMPQNIDYHTIFIAENENVYCYENQYYVTSSIFSQYGSLKEFLEMNDIYRLMFANETKVIIECMQDGVIVY